MRKWIICAALFSLTACTWLTRPMTGATLRAALDECTDNDLASLVYVRTDNSVMGVRCIPKPGEVSRTVRIRPYVPMKLIRTFSETEEVLD